MTQRQLERKLRYWQERLGLLHWRVKASFVARDELQDEDTTAEIHYDYYDEMARIGIVSYRELEEVVEGFPRDEEKELVHELLHLVMFPLVGPQQNHDDHTAFQLERTINVIAKALLRGD